MLFPPIMNRTDDDPPNLASRPILEPPFADELVTRVDVPRPTLSSQMSQSATAGRTGPPAAKISGTRLRRALILVVDDYADARETYVSLLRMTGFRTAEAENGMVALKLAREIMPDAILLDYAMPVMNGAETAWWLKRHEATRRIPIVMLTASPDRLEGRDACDAYFTKPCDSQIVTNMLRTLIQGAVERYGEAR